MTRKTSTPSAINYVRVLYEDSKGRLFVGPITVYSYTIRKPTASARERNGKTERLLTAISCPFWNVGTEKIWVSGNNLCTITITQGKLTAHKLDLPIPTQMTDYMIEDRQHNLWVTQGENGIYRLSVDNKSKHFLKQEKGMTIVDLYEDNYGDIYLATNRQRIAEIITNQQKSSFLSFIKENKTCLSNPSAR